MALWKFPPQGLNCCEDCNWFNDTFTRGDADDPGSDWSEVQGDADISSNALLVTPSGSPSQSIIQCTSSHPDTVATMKVVVTATMASSGEARAIIGYVSSSDYYYLSAQQGTPGTLSLFHYDGSHNLLVSDSQNISTTETLWVCYNSGQLIGRLTGKGPDDAISTQVTLTGTNAGVGTGSSAVTFDNFMLYKIDEDCGFCGISDDGESTCCSVSFGGPSVPGVMKIEASGFTGSEAGYNGTHFQPLVDTTECQWGDIGSTSRLVRLEHSSAAFRTIVTFYDGTNAFADCFRSPSGRCDPTQTECTGTVSFGLPVGVTVYWTAIF